MPLKPLADCRLYAFVDDGYVRGRVPADLARALCDGGADIVQLRAKKLPREEVRRQALAILPVTQAAGVWLVINDHPDIAAEVGAPCCHLGQEDFFSGAGEVGGDLRFEISDSKFDSRRMALGLSTHSPEQAVRALAARPDYIAIGPVFATPTKPGRAPVTLDYVRWAAANVPVPWFAIGGITLENLDAVLAAGATRVCVVSAILNASDVAAACAAFRDRLGKAAAVHPAT